MDLTGRMAEFMVQTTSESIPEAARAVAKQAFIDCVAVTLPGSRNLAGKTMIQFVREVGSTGRASVIGAGLRCHPSMAVLANGVSAHSLDYDDFIPALGHASTILVSLGLALGEELRLDGRTILDSYVLASEAGAKIASAMVPGNRNKGWHPTGVIGAMAAAAAAARLLRLNVDQTRNTLALAASQAGGMLRNLGSMAKPFHAGNAARSGLTAALLARSGFSGAQEILGGPMGFCAVYGGRAEELEQNFARLGSPFHLVEYGINFKKYSCCGGIHPGVDILLDFRNKKGLRPEMVKSIDCSVKKSTLNTMPYRIPNTDDEARFSMPFCLATALRAGKVGLAEFEEGKLQSPETVDLINRINILTDQEDNRVKIRVRLKDGQVMEAEKNMAKGSIDSPTHMEETVAKFLDCSDAVLSRDRASEAVGMFRQFDRLSDIQDLMEIISLSSI